MVLNNKVIVITGGSAGLGKALSDLLQKDNTVITLARSVADTEFSYTCDVGNYKNVEDVFIRIGQRFQKIDILINCAGYGLSGATEDIPEEDARAIFDTNFFGTLFVCQKALKYMVEGSKIINIGSFGGVTPMPFRALYNSSKAAVHMLSYSLKMETAPHGVEVTAILLGDTMTGFAKNRKKVVRQNGKYAEAVEKVDSFMDHRADGKKMPLLTAANKIALIAAKKRLKASYILNAKYKTAYLLNFFFPDTVLKAAYRFMVK